ncbi:Cytochrome b245, heavy chain [Trema orientale]|uniref:Cytochrome b245, heavy chain n=1 Tax=Trema orientale TaxID=63057 RepID=A0A2P5FG34_TREOI|nr:Cytochrome b245, heavy chain [Trema orientale]
MAETALLNVLIVLMILICAGWVSLWLLKPTEMWSRKWKEAEDRLRPTFFGYYGLNFVVLTFPVIALAIVGSVYLNLQLRKTRRRQGRKAFSAFSNPVVVNTLLGTLSALEILVVSLFVLLLAWTFYARVSNDVKNLMPVKPLKLKRWQLTYLRIATRFGLLAEACLALLLLPILRGLALFRLLGIQFEASVRYHIWLGTAVISFAFVHGASTLFIWGVSHYIQDEIGKWQKTGRIYLAGEIALVTGLVIWITALPQIRRKKFEIFYYTHHLYLVFLVFFLFHAGDRHFYMVFPGIFLFGLDKLLRIIQSRPETCILSAKIFPNKAIELILPKDPKLKYTPTSVIFVKIPIISKFQWHSFSITSSSSVDDHTLSVIIKCQGSWTSSLYNLINTELESDADQMKSIPIAVEGPYGHPSTDLLRYDSLLLIAGGVGITPFLSILQEVASAQQSGNQFPTRIQLIYVVKKSQDVCLLNSISHLILDQSTDQFHLKLKVFVTQEQQSGTTVRELLNEYSQVEAVDFRTDSSSYAIHGLESYLVMAVIAGLSSIVFLVFLMFLSHIFVPNLKIKASAKASKEKNPSWVADLIILSSFFISIACSSLVALIVRRRRLKKETPQISEKHVKSWQPSSIEAGGGALEKHEIHFTGRPNFQDIFREFPTETGGSDIGVIVCGPETMKESVALFCRQESQCFNIGAEKKTSFSFHSLNFTL